MQHRKWATIIAAAALAAGSGTALAHGSSHANNAEKRSFETFEEKPFGKPGDPKKATRTVRIDMSDTMRFFPETLTVKRGETIRFVVANTNRLMHEMVIGTLEELKEHAELMRKNPGMEHDEPYMAHVAPGRTETIVWQFTRPGEFYYGCLLPGHFEAGMIGKITVL
jgi:uncharacterized cupredoxin-like copper-binding protein